ncbi:MAG: ABC transporter permease [Spirochaetes bacterium]|nr:ABC transporter permease [Spirochaetota bacterium]
MKTIITMAFRNLFRNSRRTMLAVSSVSLSIALIVFFQGFYNGFMVSMIKNATRQESGHVKVTTQRYMENERLMPVKELIPDSSRIMQTIENDQSLKRDVSLVTERIRFGVLLHNRDYSSAGMCIAGDPGKEENLLMLQKSIITGRYITNERETIIGATLAKILHVGVGSNMTILTEGSDGSLRPRRLTIVGIFKTGAPPIDKGVFQITIKDAHKLLRTGGRPQEIIIMLKDYNRSIAFGTRLQKLLHDDTIAVSPWQTKSSIGRLEQFMKATFAILFFVIALLGAIIITNVMMMVILERKREIGIMKSMGFGSGDILSLFLSEGVAIGIVGSIVGTVLGAAIVIGMAIHGFDLSSFSSSFGDFPMDNVIYPTIGFANIIGSCMLGAVTAAIVSVIPSSRAARMQVIDAIKSV